MKNRLIHILILVVLASPQLILAQMFDMLPAMPLELHKPLDNLTRNALRNASMLESQGEFEKALNIYQDIFAKYPEYSPFYDGVVRCFVSSGKYFEGLAWTDSLKKVMLSQGTVTNFTPPEREQYANVIIDGGRFCNRLNRREEAFKRWEEVYTLTTTITSTAYYRLFSAVVETRMPDQLEEMVHKARQAIHDPTLLSSSLAEYWAQQGEIGRAVAEYLTLMELQPRMSDGIASRVLSLPEDSVAVQQVESSLKAALSHKTIKLQVTQLLSALYFRARQWELAYEQIKTADHLGDRSGVSVLEYAEKLNSEKEYHLAIKVLDDLTKSYPNLTNSPRLLLLRAVALEGAQLYSQADSIYSTLTSAQNIRNAMGQEALIHQANLRLNRLKQPESARKLLESGLLQVPNLIRSYEAALLIADTYLAERDFGRARSKYLEAAGGRFGSDPAQRTRALVNAALIDFYSGSFSQAKEQLVEATKLSPDQELTNDALDVLDIIRSAEADSSGLRLFAQAKLEDRLGQSGKAEAIYLSVTQTVKSGDLVERAFWRLAEIERAAGKSTDAVKYLEESLQRFPHSLRTPEVLLMMGEIYVVDLKNPKRGFEIYEKILTDYPQSLQVEEARRHLRQLDKPET